MQVLTLNQDKYKQLCKSLEAICVAYEPDLIIGIANGGAKVASEIFADVKHSSITCQRPSTKNKGNGMAKKLLKMLPYSVLDALRIAESKYLHHKARKIKTITPQPHLANDISQARRILIIDDAVDSGVTLAAVTLAIKKITSPDCEVKTAAITVTQSAPEMMPDYYIYDDGTLLRFPWSIDMKQG